MKRFYARIERLENRRSYLQAKVDAAELDGFIPDYTKGELSALEWALPILKDYINQQETTQGEMYWIREYNLLLDKNTRLYEQILFLEEN